MQLKEPWIERRDRRRERCVVRIDRQQDLARPLRGATAEPCGQLQRDVPGTFVEKNKADHVGAAPKCRVEPILRRKAADFDNDAHKPDTGIDLGDR
jgi:hypothetical protein